MADEGLVARPKRRHRGLTRADKRARRAPDLVGRDYSALAPTVKWCGDFKQIDTDEGPLYLGSVEDFYSRRLLGFAMSERYPTAELAKAAINMAVAVRGGDVAGVIFHSDQGQYTSIAHTDRLDEIDAAPSIGTVGDSFDNAMAEALNGTFKAELVHLHGPWRTASSSNTPRSTGSIGTTRGGCTARSMTSHPSNTKPTGTVTTPACCYPNTNQPALHESRGGSVAQNQRHGVGPLPPERTPPRALARAFRGQISPFGFGR
jgi:transposase InsO family protein